MYRQKIVSAETEILEKGLVSAVVSTEHKDRDGDIIRAEGWELDHFNAHPVLLSSHNYTSLRSQIGHWEEMKVVGKTLKGVARYYVGDGNEEADWGFKLAERGKAAYSVGFIPDFSKATELKGGDEGFFPHYEFKGQELLEVSHVTVPSNRQSLQQAKGFAKDPVIIGLIDDLLGETTEEPDELEKLVQAVLAKLRPEMNRCVEEMIEPVKEALAELKAGPPMPDFIFNPDPVKHAMLEAISHGH